MVNNSNLLGCSSMVERSTVNADVEGSSPSVPAKRKHAL